MGKTNAFRPETLIKRIVSTVPAASATYAVNLPAGAYYLMMVVYASVTGSTTDVGLLVKYTNDAQTTFTAAQMGILEEDDTTFAAEELTLAAGVSNRTVRIFDVRNPTEVAASPPVVLPHGFRLTVTKGGATTGETLLVDVVAVRIG